MSELILLCSAAALDRDDARAGGSAVARAAKPARELLRAGALQNLFSRARLVTDRQDQSVLPRELPEHDWLRRRYALAAEDSLEAFAALHYGIALPAWHLTPSHVTIGLDHAMLVDPGQLRLDPQESDTLAETAAELFSGYGLTLHASAPDTWFLTGDTKLDLRGHDWRMASGRNVDAYLPTGPDARLWRRMLSEVQMAWFAHPVNQAREARGEAVVNMLWLNGRAASITANPAAARDVLIGAGAAVAGTVQAHGGRHLPNAGLPGQETLQELCKQTGIGALLIDCDLWSAARRVDDAQAWLDAWKVFDEWLRETVTRVLPASGRPQLRIVLTGERRTVELLATRKDRWQVWRRLDASGLIL